MVVVFKRSGSEINHVYVSPLQHVPAGGTSSVIYSGRQHEWYSTGCVLSDHRERTCARERGRGKGEKII